MTFDLLALGNPLLDLQADVDAEYLAKYDLKANDAILIEDKHKPIFDEVMAQPKVHILAGGAAQNAARGAQYLLPANSVIYFGSVGQDKYAELLTKANDEAGVYSNYMVQKDIPTGKCAALITGNDRSLVTDLAAANHYKLDHLKAPENWKYVEEAKAFYVGGFHLTVCPPAINALGEHAAETNKIFSINLSAPFLPQFFKEPLDASSPYWDYLIGNESEALAYAESHGLDTKDITEIAKHIALLPKKNTKRDRVVVITQGLDDTIVVIGDVNNKTTTVHTFPVHPISSEDIVDSNGAGDAFAGGFLAGLVSGKPLAESVDMGQWLAAQSLREIGPSFPSPKKAYTSA
ncbi:adenosine kinase [Sugiyamaella lignohabitans]|uniref:Adenosine kinase n=1 Tax=Sugiyamaella lignohabitans TaxID=796027 RepID=A0A167CTY6_9ASCO|nr:adenosine kinase [Sugiyamaella lignohabitans]ANB12103.1 adenosine kinase [Sugiyamaella lignohabitans]